MTRAARDQDAHGVECLHCVLLDGQFIYANADQNVEVGVVAATRPVDVIMSPAVGGASLGARRNTRLRCADPGSGRGVASTSLVDSKPLQPPVEPAHYRN